MALFNTLDIPPGLEDYFYRLLSLSNTGTSVGVRNKPSTGDSKKKARTVSRSLFVQWNDIYNGLTISQKAGWTAYWLTLPYGSHSGMGGWPGSGFSGFVYFNAARRRLGQGLQLDAPEALGPELVINSAFAGNANDWLLEGSGGGEFSYADDRIQATMIDGFSEGYAYGALDPIVDSMYRLQLDLIVTGGAGDSTYLKIGVSNGNSPFGTEPIFNGNYLVADLVHLSADYQDYVDDEPRTVTIKNEFVDDETTIYIDNVSLRRIF